MNMTVPILMDRMYKNMLLDFGKDLLERCGARHSFDVEEEMRALGVYNLEVNVGVKKKVVKEKRCEEKRAVPRIPFPYSGLIVQGCCAGLKQNHGLMSQCLSFPSENNDKNLCKVCKRESDKNASGEPNCGLVRRRQEEGINFKDAKGRSPTLYTKVMKKLKLTEEQVLSEASKFQIPFNKEHFNLSDTKKGRPKKGVEESDTEEESKKRGRPKKDKKEVEVSSNDNDDLFANLISSAVEEQSQTEEQAEEVVAKAPKKEASKKEAPKKEAPKKEETKKEETKKEASKKEETKKEASKKEAPRKEETKAPKKEETKAPKKEETKAPKKEEKKDTTRALVGGTQGHFEREDAKNKIEEDEEGEEDGEVVDVKKIEFKGKKYLKSATNVMYALSGEPVGVWNEAKQEIVFNELEDEDEDDDEEDDEEDDEDEE